MIISSASSGGPALGADQRGRRLWVVAVMVLVAALLQGSLMPFIVVARGIPDVLVCVIVAVGLLRGPLVGAVAGAAGGFVVELTSPVGTLGVLALLYLVVGWGAGRLCGREEVRGLLPPIVLCLIGELVVQLGDASAQLLLARSLAFGDVVRTLIASAILTGLVSVPVLALSRRLLGAPWVVEPFVVSGDA